MADQDWNHFLQQSSAIGIIKPDAVGGVFRGGGQTGPAASTTSPADLDPVAIRVVRTAHAPNGRSIFAADEFVCGYYPYSDGAAFATVDRRSAIPVVHKTTRSSSSSSSGTSSGSTSSTSPPRCPSTGAAFVLCEIPPYRAAMPMRRTLTVDYVVVVSGSLTVCLDGDMATEKTVRAGDVLVQQGTQHAWLNRTGEPCRLLYVMLAGKKIALGGGNVLDKSG